MPAGDQSWVTAALNDSYSLKALVLARSLRRVITAQKLTVLTSRNVSDPIKTLLEDEFDVVINIDLDDSATKGLPDYVYSKLYSWKLTFFKKCVFLDPDTLVLENCDEMFDWEEISAAPDTTRPNCFDPTVFVLKPSFKTFSGIMKYVQTEKVYKENGHDILNLYFKSWVQSNSEEYHLPIEYNTAVTFNSTFEQFSSNIKVVRFVGANPLQESQDEGSTRKSKHGTNTQYYEILAQVWMNIFQDDIQPKLTSAMTVDPEFKINGYKFHQTPQSMNSSRITKDNYDSLSDAIAIVGHSCRFPGANSPEEFWELLLEGKDAIQGVPLDRWNTYPRDDDTNETKAGFLKCPIDEFDAKFFGISPREAAFIDPQQRLLLEVAWEGLENAGINPLELKGSNTGVFVGVWAADYERMLRNVMSSSDAHRIYLGNAYSATSARVSFFLGLDGPNIATESGCSSSFVSLHLACDSLRRKECNLALAGGVNLLLQAFPLEGPGKPYFLAPDGHCKTFDAKANGFGRAEGCGVIILKRFSDAQRDGDRIMAIVRGSAVNSEGTTANFGAPSKNCQTKVIQDALKTAAVDPLSVSYIEAHGTGTTVGDPIEVSAIAAAYSEGRKEPLVISSVKTNIGHTEGAAGVAGLIKVVLAMQHGLIPPHRNFESPNPNIDFAAVPALIPVKAHVWKNEAGKSRIAGVSSFGISGTNVHVLVEEPPTAIKIKPRELECERPQHILTLSAKTEDALNELVIKYQNFLKNNPLKPIENVAYTANTGRAHFVHRIAVVGKDSAQMQNRLETKMYSVGKSPSPKPLVAFLFTGQGCQYPGMAKRLYNTHPVFRKSLDKCSKLLQNNLGINLLDAIWKEGNNDNNSTLLDKTLYSQTSIFCIEYSLLKLWESFGVIPDCVLGHSVGEFAAATAAGVMCLEDAIKLVSERSRLIQSMPQGGMLAVKASREIVQNLLHSFSNQNEGLWLDIAVINSSEEVVVAGRPNSLEIFAEVCTKEGIKTLRVAASHAFHSREMEGIMGPFGKVASSIKYRAPECLYVSGRDGKCLEKTDIDSKYWQNHARDSVNFTAGIKTLFDQGCRTFLEIGPHPILLALGMTNVSPEEAQESTWLPSIRKNEEEWISILSSLARLYVKGIDVDWENFDLPYCRKKLELPTYPFQRQKYWFDSTARNQEMILNTKLLHPLVGRKAPCAATSELMVNIYQQSLDLEYLSYLKDHQVANRIILPGAGFLEMILAAGNLSVLSSGNESIHNETALVVQEFMIEAPLELGTDEGCHLQILASPIQQDTPNEFKVSVFKRSDVLQPITNTNPKWKRFASAKFSTSTTTCGNNLSLEELEAIKIRCKPKISTEELYKKAPELGIFFGPTFQSIKSFWKTPSEVLAEIPIPEEAGNLQEYIGHPVVLDAMIQAFALTMDEESKSLYLPIGVDKFVFYARNTCKTMFAHTTWADPNNRLRGTVKLYDDKGQQLALMEGVRVVRTTVAAFLNALNSNKRELPGLYHEIWKAKEGTLSSRIDLGILPQTATLEEKLRLQLQDCEDVFQKTRKGESLYNKFVRLLILKSFYELKWQPKVGEIFQSRDFMTNHIISPRHQGLIEMFFRFFTQDGLMEQQVNLIEDVIEWKVIEAPPSLVDLKLQLETLAIEIRQVAEEVGDTLVEMNLINRVGENLAAVLQNKMSGLNVLFPEEEEEGSSAAAFYLDSKMYTSANKILPNILQETFGHLSGKGRSTGTVVRILEIGAGIGSTTEYVLSSLKKMNVTFHYTFTDISPLFLSKAKEKFEEYGNSVSYGLLNIETDPKKQGFAPNQFDVVIAANVLHATESLKQSVTNVRHLMVPSGQFLLIEAFEQIRVVHLAFGILEGWWRFKDFDIRADSPLIKTSIWQSILTQHGFSSSTMLQTFGHFTGVLVSQASGENPVYSSPSETCWLVFAEDNQQSQCLLSSLKQNFANVTKRLLIIQRSSGFQEVNEDYYGVNPTVQSDFKALFGSIQQKNCIIEGMIYLWGYRKPVEECDQEYISGGLLNLSQSLMSSNIKSMPKLLVVTEGVCYIGDQSAVNPSAATLSGLAKVIRSEQAATQCFSVDLDPDETDTSVLSRELFDELWSSDIEFQVAYRQKRRHVVRFMTRDLPASPLVLPNSERYKLVLPASKTIADLSLGSMPKVEVLAGQVEVAVKAVGLNFRDIFMIMKPDTYTSLFEAVGTDFAGVVTAIGPDVTKFKLGDEVFGLSTTGAICSHVTVAKELIIHKPKNITMEEAAAFPSVYFTAFYSLIDIANLKSTDTILIHSASGGVGLAAVQIAQKIGAQIVATAGSKRKRAYLKSLGITHVFNSRNTDYGDEIEAALKGKGIDVVLNSLTSTGFKEATLRVCNPNARFIEMGKVRIWQPEDVKALRPDVQYSIVDLEKFDNATFEGMVGNLRDTLTSGNQTPLPYVRFELSQLIGAFNYFQEAQHIGKLVIVMPEIKYSYGRVEATDNLFNAHSTYLITGGMGGIGLEVAKWMVSAGAKNVILVGRSAPNSKVQEVVDDLCSQGRGVRVIIKLVDVGDLNQCQDLMNWIKQCDLKLPPLRGIMHAAGALSDGMLVNQTWSKFSTVFNAKVNGAWNLHILTKDYNLDHFVLYSSVAGLLGPLGQSNHTAANAFLDTLAHYRHSLGLPAQSVNWGIWGEIGAAADMGLGKEGAFGLKPFTPGQGIAALKYIMRNHYVQTAVLELDASVMKQQYSTLLGNYFEELVSENKGATAAQISAEAETFWNEIKQTPQEERYQYIKGHLERIIRHTLKMPDSETIDEHQSFSEMGMDSLMAVEMRNRLQMIFGKHVTLNATSLLDHPNLHGLSGYLAELVNSAEVTAAPESKPEFNTEEGVDSPEMKIQEKQEICQLVQEDSILPAHIKAIGTNYVKPSEFKNILFTGATGQLGIYILNEISRIKNIRVYCLLRAKNPADGRKRLTQKLKKFDLLQSTMIDTLEFLPGNIAESKLGLTDMEYEKLAGSIDAIIHCAVKANHIEKYKKYKNSVNHDIRSVNVFGTINILEFACQIKIKKVFHASSIVAIDKISPDGRISEELPFMEDNGESISWGYALSKFVCEKLMRQAIERGIPCSVIRFPTIVGHSQTGMFAPETNHLMLFLLACIHLGMAPVVGGSWASIPVDTAAKISLNIFLNDSASTGAYNITNPYVTNQEQTNKVVQDHGYNVSVVSYKEWKEGLSAKGESSVLYPLRDIYLKEDGFLSLIKSSPATELAFSDDNKLFRMSEKVSQVVPNVETLIPHNADILSRHMDYAKKSGLYKLFGIDD